MATNGLGRVVVLGGSAGIGFAVAEQVVAQGGSVAIVSSSGERVRQAVAALGTQAEGHTADLFDESQIRALFEKLGPFDHLVYTAGDALDLRDLAATDLQQAQGFFELRYWGALAAVKYSSPQIRPGGSIVLTTGIASLRPRKGWALAASVCGAMDGLTRALAMELAPLRVNAVSPGVVRTDVWRNMSEADRSQMYDSVGRALPVGRVGEAQDVAQTYLYLMRQEFGTGQVLVVDGGTVLV